MTVPQPAAQAKPAGFVAPLSNTEPGALAMIGVDE
jgi:hypothetical protein